MFYTIFKTVFQFLLAQDCHKNCQNAVSFFLCYSYEKKTRIDCLKAISNRDFHFQKRYTNYVWYKNVVQILYNHLQCLHIAKHGRLIDDASVVA